MTQPAYPAARIVAAKVQAHFARHLAAARERGRDDLPEAPTQIAIEALIDAAFWASLRREEGVTPTISLAYVPVERAGHPLRFAAPIPLRPAPLAKVAPAVERPGIHLGVWQDDYDFHVWGTTRDVPAFCLVVEVVASGLIVIKHRSEPFGKFVNVAVLEGDQVKVVDEAGGAAVPDCPQLVKTLLGFAEGFGALDPVNVLVEVAASMRAHGRGGALLLVPADSSQWRESVATPMLYAVEPPPHRASTGAMARGQASRSARVHGALRGGGPRPGCALRDNIETLFGAIDDGALAFRIPRHARKELLAYLDCGLLCRGFARLKCRGCSETRLVAFSCKGRGFCPSWPEARLRAAWADACVPQPQS